MTPMFTVGRENAIKPSQVHPGLGHQRSQLGDKIQQLKDDLRGAIAVWRL
jgi:hypothetical protein